MNDIETRDTGTKNDNSSEFNLSVKSHKRKRSFDDENLELEESREEISGGILKKAKTQSFSESLERFRFAHAGSNNEYRKTDVVKNSDTDNGLLKSAVETITLENGLRNRRVNVTKKSTLKASVKKSTLKKKNEVDPALLQGVPDYICENPYAIIVGLNPGITSSLKGHAFASPSSRFWKMLNKSKLLEGNAEFTYLNDKDLPAHGLGITNLCARPSSSGADLRKEEMQDGARILYEKVKRYRPQVGLFISGKGIWEEMYKMLTGKKLPKTFVFGWQPEKFGDANVFVGISSSGRAAGYSDEKKQNLWNLFAEEVNRHREIVKHAV
ncbi:G/U mismatch-specific uracil DNA glycosylase [Schizosaccharomyces pombe]